MTYTISSSEFLMVPKWHHSWIFLWTSFTFQLYPMIEFPPFLDYGVSTCITCPIVLAMQMLSDGGGPGSKTTTQVSLTHLLYMVILTILIL